MNFNKLTEYRLTKSNPSLAIFKAVQDMKQLASEFVSEAIKKEKKIIQEEMNSELKEAILNFKESIKSIENKAIDKLENLSEDFNKKHSDIIKIITEKIQKETVYDLLQRMPELKGKDGHTPIKGRDYFDGKNGYIPIKGRDYFTQKEINVFLKKTIPIKGKDYFDGHTPIKGRDYFDGSPDTPKQIAEKLNTLSEIIDLKVIKGLAQEFSIIKQNIKQSFKTKQKGGGMGNFSPFSFTGDGTTTSFTLPNTPTNNGAAIMVYDNGQALKVATHFTVSGLTLSLTYIPSDGAIIFGWLIR